MARRIKYEAIKLPELSSLSDSSRVTHAGLRRTNSSLSRWEPNAERLALLQKCRDSLQKRIGGPIETLFLKLTGLHLHVVWHRRYFPTKPQGIRCPAMRSQLNPNGQAFTCCSPCLQKHWNAPAQPDSDGQRFVGRCGLTSFRIGFHVGKIPLLTLQLQAQIKGKNSPRRADVSAITFRHAVNFLRFVQQDLETIMRESLGHAATDRLERWLKIAALENTRLRQGPPRRPKLSAPANHQAADSRAQQLVQEMVAYVHQHYHRPMSLGQVAAAMKMNAAYLCDLFSRTLGVTFHQYVTELRMNRAKELLREPHRRVCEVACAVGFASADQFRHTFKAQVGVSPSAWR